MPSKPIIVVSHTPDVKDKKFSFAVNMYPNSSDKRSATVSIVCSKGLLCSPQQQEVMLSAPDLKPFTAEELDVLNSAEIDVSLAIKGGQTLGDAQVIDFGLFKTIAKIGTDAPKEFKAGEATPIHLWLEDAGGNRLRPTSTVVLQMSRSADCAELKALSNDEDSQSKAYGPNAATSIPEWGNEAVQTVWVRPYHWSQSACSFDLVLKSAGDPIFRSRLPLPIKPDYGPALAACLIGAFAQYLLASFVQIVLLARAKGSVNLRHIFVGTNCVEIIEMFLKGLLSFLLAYVLNTTELIQFKGAENNSLLGFGTFAFLIGFWQLKPLWDAIRNLSKADDKNQQPINTEPPVPTAVLP